MLSKSSLTKFRICMAERSCIGKNLIKGTQQIRNFAVIKCIEISAAVLCYVSWWFDHDTCYAVYSCL